VGEHGEDFGIMGAGCHLKAARFVAWFNGEICQHGIIPLHNGFCPLQHGIFTQNSSPSPTKVVTSRESAVIWMVT
jgi:hypothetical protein